MSCFFGHKWDGCVCKRCGETRDEGHDFRPKQGKCSEKCIKCGKTRPLPHQWKGCTCERCGEIRDEGHDYHITADWFARFKWSDPVKTCIEFCSICGCKREAEHDWNGCTCERCGTIRDTGHDYQLEEGKCSKKCSICGKALTLPHHWNGCTCERCGAARSEGHDYQPEQGKCSERCSICGKIRPLPHLWKGDRCECCGMIRDELRMAKEQQDISRVSTKSGKKNRNEVKPRINIVTIGQEGHGKTTLAAAITSVLKERYDLGEKIDYEEINCAKERRENGIFISSTDVRFETSNRQYSLIDYPTNEDYVKSMIVRNERIDGVILVVDATEGLTKQTREQLMLAGLEMISCHPYIVVFLNKCDLVDDKQKLDWMESEIDDVIYKYGFYDSDIPYIRGSATGALEDQNSQWGSKIAKLIQSMFSYIQKRESDTKLPFLMPVEDVCNKPGRGTIVTGTVERGIINTGDEVEIVGLNNDYKKAVVTRIELFRK